MTRSRTVNRKLVALALLAGAGGACSNATEEDASDTTGQEQYAQQIQSELDAASAANPNTANSVRSVRPVLKCVDKLPNNQYKAHFGYTNSATTSVSIPVGFFNRFWPPPISRGQPTTFAPGSQADVVQVQFSGFSASVWVLGTHFSFATKFSKVCPAGGTGGATGTGGQGTGGVGTGGHTGTGGMVVGTGGRIGTGGMVAGTGGMVVGTGGRIGTGGTGTGGTIVGTGGTIVGTGGTGTGGTGTGGSGTGGHCVAPTNCDDQNPCTLDSVDTAQCICVHVAAMNGTSCSDGNACTQGDICTDGLCTMGTPVLCNAPDVCHTPGTCDPATGGCVGGTNAANGTPCNDNNACTAVDTCQLGVCTGGSPKTCAPLDQCHVAGICDTTTGTCPNPNANNGTPCSDGNACTSSDTCQAGSCTGGPAKTCSPLDSCHVAGTCDTVSGNCSNPAGNEGGTCDDANACTTGDTCHSGSCTPGTPKVCPVPTNSCQIAGACDSTTGLCSTGNKPDGSTCDDGNSCSTGDRCVAGACQAVSSLPPSHCPTPPANPLLCDQCTFGVNPGDPNLCAATPDDCSGADSFGNCSPPTDGCDTLTDPTDKTLCENLYACLVAPTHPGTSVPGPCVKQGDPLQGCWCGTNPTTCTTDDAPLPTQANGPCLQQIFAAAKSNVAAFINQHSNDPTLPLGRAVNLAACRSNFCSPECNVNF